MAKEKPRPHCIEVKPADDKLGRVNIITTSTHEGNHAYNLQIAKDRRRPKFFSLNVLDDEHAEMERRENFFKEVGNAPSDDKFAEVQFTFARKNIEEVDQVEQKVGLGAEKIESKGDKYGGLSMTVEGMTGSNLGKECEQMTKNENLKKEIKQNNIKLEEASKKVPNRADDTVSQSQKADDIASQLQKADDTVKHLQSAEDKAGKHQRTNGNVKKLLKADDTARKLKGADVMTGEHLKADETDKSLQKAEVISQEFPKADQTTRETGKMGEIVERKKRINPYSCFGFITKWWARKKERRRQKKRKAIEARKNKNENKLGISLF